MTNIIKVFINTINIYQSNVLTITNSNNRVNNIGFGLEEFIKDIFTRTINETNEQNRLTTFSQTYPYSGNKNNPPDLIPKNSDAIEIKNPNNTVSLMYGKLLVFKV